MARGWIEGGLCVDCVWIVCGLGVRDWELGIRVKSLYVKELG